MVGNNIAVFGICPSVIDAERGAADLISAGYSSQDISVLLADARSAAAGHLDGALGILTGLGAFTVPGVGPVVAAGPILAGLADLGLGEYDEHRYLGRVKDGEILLSVHCENPARVKRAKQVLNSSGADDVAASHESRDPSVGLAAI